MKNFWRNILVLVGLIICLTSSSQTVSIPAKQVVTANTNSIAVPYLFSNTNDFQIYSAIVSLYTAMSGTTGTNFKDNSNDTLNGRIKAIRDYTYNFLRVYDRYIVRKLDSTINAIITGTNINISTVSRTPMSLTSSSTTSSGTVLSGPACVAFETSSTFIGSIDGMSVQANSIINFNAGPYKSLPAIPFTISSGNMIIRKLE